MWPVSSSLWVCSCCMWGEEHPRVAVLKLLVSGGSRKRGDVTRGAVCVSEHPGTSVTGLCPDPARAGPSPGERQDLSPLLLELQGRAAFPQGRAEGATGRDLVLVPQLWHSFPRFSSCFFFVLKRG